MTIKKSIKTLHNYSNANDPITLKDSAASKILTLKPQNSHSGAGLPGISPKPLATKMPGNSFSYKPVFRGGDDRHAHILANAYLDAGLGFLKSADEGLRTDRYYFMTLPSEAFDYFFAEHNQGAFEYHSEAILKSNLIKTRGTIYDDDPRIAWKNYVNKSQAQRFKIPGGKVIRPLDRNKSGNVMTLGNDQRNHPLDWFVERSSDADKYAPGDPWDWGEGGFVFPLFPRHYHGFVKDSWIQYWSSGIHRNSLGEFYFLSPHTRKYCKFTAVFDSMDGYDRFKKKTYWLAKLRDIPDEGGVSDVRAVCCRDNFMPHPEDIDMFDDITLSLKFGPSVKVKRISAQLNGKIVFDSNDVGYDSDTLLTRSKPIKLKHRIRTYRKRIVLPNLKGKSDVLVAAAMDYGKSWTPKYGCPFGNLWCSEFARYCFRQGGIRWIGGTDFEDSESTAGSVANKFINRDRFFQKKYGYRWDDIGDLVAPGSFVSIDKFSHATLFYDWGKGGYNKNDDSMSFWVIGGCQDGHRVTVKTYMLWKNIDRKANEGGRGVLWSTAYDYRKDGFGGIKEAAGIRI